MASDKRYSRTIELNGVADFSNIVNAVKKLRSEVEGKASNTDLLGIDKQLEKIVELQTKIRKVQDKGISSPQEMQELKRLTESLLSTADDLETKFQNIHLRGIDKEVSNLDKSLKQAQKNVNDLSSKIENMASKSLKGITGEKDYVKQITEAAANEEKLSQIKDQINKQLDNEIKKQQQLKKERESSVVTLEQQLKAQIDARANTGLGDTQIKGSEKLFSWKSGSKNLEILPEQYAQLVQKYKEIVKSTENAEAASRSFNKVLRDMGVTVQKDWQSTIKSYFDTAFSNSGETDKLKSSLKDVNSEITNISNTINTLSGQKTNINSFFNSEELTKLVNELKVGKISVEDFTEKLARSQAIQKNPEPARFTRDLTGAIQEQKKAWDENAKSIQSVANTQIQLDSTADFLINGVKRVLSLTSAWYGFKRAVSSTFNDIKALDKSFGSIAMVTDMTVADLWGQYDTYAQLASKLGQSTQSVIEASGLYYQQGLKTSEVMSLTEETMKLATLAGLDFKEATSQMTAAIRAFKMEMTDGAHVTDVYAEIAAHAAVDVQGISEAMSATAAIAHSAGMEFETTSAMLATMVEATQEAPKNLGTAMKTIIARFTELKENVAGTADSEFDDLDYNKVDKALKSVGVSLKDTSGQFRDLDDVFLELSAKWDSLDRNSQRYIATIAAGSRQQSRFIALMENYERTTQLIEIAQNSAGKSTQQFAKYSSTLEYETNKLSNSWERLRTNFLKSDFYKTTIKGLTGITDSLRDLGGKKLLALSVIFLTLGRRMAQNIIKGFQDASGAISSNVNKVISTATNKISNKAQIQLRIAIDKAYWKQLDIDLAKINTQIEETKKKIADTSLNSNLELGGADALVDAYRLGKTNPEHPQALELETLTEKERELLELLDQEYQALEKNNAARKDGSAAQEEANKKISQMAKQRTQQLGTAIGTALTTAISTAIASDDPFDVLKTTGTMFATVTLPQIATTIVGLITKTTTVAEAKFAAATMGISLAITAAIAGLTALIKWAESNEQKKAETWAKKNSGYVRWTAEVERLSEKQEELNQNLDKANKEFDEAQERFNTLEDGSKKIEEYQEQVALTNEEQEEFINLQNELAEQFPSLISYYDEQGNAILTKIAGAWEIAREEQRKYYAEAGKEQAKKELDAETNELLTKSGELKALKDYSEEITDKQLSTFLTLAQGNYAVGNVPITYDESSGKFMQGNYQMSYGNVGAEEMITGWIESGEGEKYGKILSKLLEDSDYTAIEYNQPTGTKFLEDLRDLLTEGNTDEENQTWEEIIERIKTSRSKVGSQLGTAQKEYLAAQKEFDDALTNTIEQYGIGSDTYINASKNVQSLINEYIKDTNNLTYDELQAEFEEKAKEEHPDWFKDGELIEVESFNDAFNEYVENTSIIINDKIDEIGNVFTEQQQAYIDAFYESAEKNGWGVIERIRQMQQSTTISKDIKASYYKTHAAEIEGINEDRKQFAKAFGIMSGPNREELTEGVFLDTYGAKGSLINWVMSQNDAIETALEQTFINMVNNADLQEEGQQAAKDFIIGWKNTIEKYNLSDEQQAEILNANWSNVKPTDAENYKKSLIHNWAKLYGEAQAQAMAEESYNYAKASGSFSDEAVFWTNAESTLETMTVIAEKIKETKDNWSSIVGKDGIIQIKSEEYEKLEQGIDKLEEAGMNVTELRDALGEYNPITQEWSVNATVFNSILDESSAKTADIVSEWIELNKQQIKNNKEKIASGKLDDDTKKKLEEENESLESTNKELEEAQKNQQKLNNIIKDTISFENDVNKQIRERINLISSLQSAYETAMNDMLSNGRLTASSFETLDKVLKEHFNGTAADFVSEDGILNAGALKGYIQQQVELLDLTKDNSKETQIYFNFLLTAIDEYGEKLEKETNKLSRDAASAQLTQQQSAISLAKAYDTLNEKIKTYNELIHGSANYRQPLDNLYNYTTMREEAQLQRDRAKNILDNPLQGDNIPNALSKYLSGTRAEIGYLQGENKVRQNFAKQADKTLFTDLQKMMDQASAEIGVPLGTFKAADYIEKIGNMYRIKDLNKFNALPINDEIKNFAANAMKEANENQKVIEKNEDEIRKRQEEAEQMRKEAADKMVSIENDMKNALKEKYQEEIDDLQNKYDAMTDADNDYLSALEDAIKKERDLRERQNDWDELATKEKKLSLMQRDTSGVNQLQVQQLEEEVQDDREKLLDNAIDDVIDGLKELYELQQENRDTEIEYRESLLTDAQLLAEVTEALEHIENADDFVNWYASITDMSDKSAAEAEAMTTKWADAFTDIEFYRAAAQVDFTDSITVTSEEVNTIISENSEDLTTKLQSDLTTLKDSVVDAIKNAQEEVQSAELSLQQQQLSMQTQIEATTEAINKYNQALSLQQNLNNNPPPTEPDPIPDNWLNGLSSGIDNAKAGINSEQHGWNNDTAQAFGEWFAQENQKQPQEKSSPSDSDVNKIVKDAANRAGNDPETYLNLLKGQPLLLEYYRAKGGQAIKNSVVRLFNGDSSRFGSLYIAEQNNDLLMSRFPFAGATKYATGGLVNYTGPAWVDGSPSRPEAFLSADDTEMIGSLVDLLQELTFTNRSFSNMQMSTVGDTTIELTVNFDSVSEDYDSDRVIELMQQKIVEAANYTGSNVILHKR